MMRALLTAILIVVALSVAPSAATAATCASYSNQAAAQRAADTRDADGDGVYCESLPCPCSAGSNTPAPPPPPAAATPAAGCKRPAAVQRLRFSSTTYPNIKKHALAAIAAGWPRILILNRPDADGRRDRLLENIPTKNGFDRDEYPPAVGRGRANGSQHGLVQGFGPLGWKADVAYVNSSENRSQGASMGAKLRGLCNGTRFRYAFM